MDTTQLQQYGTDSGLGWLFGHVLEPILENHMAQIPSFLKPYAVIVAGQVFGAMIAFAQGGNWKDAILAGIVTTVQAIRKHDSDGGSNLKTNT